MDFAERLYSHYRLAILLSLIEEPAEERLRFAVLRVLSRIPGRAATVSMVEELLGAYGFEATRDEVEAVIAWAERARLVKGSVDNGVRGALLLDLGRDVAGGRAAVPGVAPAATVDWLQANLEAKSIRLGLAELTGHVEWCRDRQLVTGDGTVLSATQRGRDVALGREEIDGVKAPSTATIMRLAAAGAADRLKG